MKNINGFMFNDIGDLISKPIKYDLVLLTNTYIKLISDREYISASRIQYLINQYGFYK